jgi:glycosyltransferase involved in cell wall biosynthesis
VTSAGAPFRLGYLIPEFPAQTHVFFWREAAALTELGVQVRWLSTRAPAPEACRHAFAQQARGLTHYVYPPRWGRALTYLLARPARTLSALAYLVGLRESSLRQRLRLLGLLACAADLAAWCRAQPIDHLHVHSCADAAHLAALFGRLTGVPYSLTLHGDLPVYGRDQAAKMRDARFVSVVTADLQRQVTTQVGLPVERVPVVRMGVDTRHFTPSSERVHAAGRLHAVTVARLAECKGHRYALQAMRTLVDEGLDLTYTIAGSGPDEALVRAEVLRQGLEPRVRFAGTLSEAEVLALLQGADVFVLPSVGLGEAAPVAVMEAMACGTPTVCSIIGGTPELVSDGADGFLVTQGDVAGLHHALRRLALSEGEHARLAHAARATAVAAFDHRRWARDLLAGMRP